MILCPSTKVDRRSRRALRAAVASVGLESLEGRRLFAVTLNESQAPITNAPPALGEMFGDKMDARDGIVAVGLPAANGGIGEARVFDANGNLIATLINPEPESDDSFGDVVSVIDSTHIAVRSVEGFTGDINNADNPIVYIFDLEGDLNNPVVIGAPEDNDFGNSLAVVGGDLLISTPMYDGGQGGVYRFDVTGAPVNHATDDGPSNVYTLDGAVSFGQAMAADADGSTMLFSNGFGTGRTVVRMDANGQVLNTYEEASDAGQSGSFAIAFNDDSVFVGDSNVGRVTQFDLSTEAIIGEITEPTALLFGASVIANGDYVVVGAALDAVNVYDDDFGDGDNAAVANAALPAGTFIDGVYNLGGTEFLVADPFVATDDETPSAGKLYVFDLADLDDNGPSTPTVTGGSGNDTITVTQNGTTLTVTVNGVPTTYENLPLLVIHGGAGNDTIGIGASVTTAIEAHGGDGNDLISGGGGADVLVGGAGSDVLIGQGGRDVLIGGDGSDILLGMAADDVLIAGATAHDDDSATLQSISAIWNGAQSYSDRVNALKAGPLTLDEDIYDDGEIDIVSGNGGTDWFVINNDGSLFTRDLVLDRSSGEIRDDVDAFIPA